MHLSTDPIPVVDVMNRLFAALMFLSFLSLAMIGCESRERRVNFQDCDEEWQTKVTLSEFLQRLNRFNTIASEEDKRSMSSIRTLHGLWSLLHEKHDSEGALAPTPTDKAYPMYMMDAWNQPYALEIKTIGQTTTIRIASKPPQGKEISVEATFDEKGGRTRRSWDSYN
jgi:hypothetical protein